MTDDRLSLIKSPSLGIGWIMVAERRLPSSLHEDSRDLGWDGRHKAEERKAPTQLGSTCTEWHSQAARGWLDHALSLLFLPHPSLSFESLSELPSRFSTVPQTLCSVETLRNWTAILNVDQGSM
jgi:hypothetical protein